MPWIQIVDPKLDPHWPKMLDPDPDLKSLMPALRGGVLYTCKDILRERVFLCQVSAGVLPASLLLTSSLTFPPPRLGSFQQVREQV